MEVIEAILSGALRYKSIASALNISVNTVKTHLRKIYQTVGVNNTEALASLFHGYSSSNTDFTLKSPIKNKKSPQIGDKNQHIFAVILNIVHSGGKKMQKLKTLRKRTLVGISLILAAVLVIGFTAIKLVLGNLQTKMEFGVTAEPVSDGILLSFSNIPEDTTHMWISVYSFGYTDESGESLSIIDDSFAAIVDASVQTSVRNWSNSSYQLDKVKQTGKVIFPIVKSGEKYSITVSVYDKEGFELLRNNDSRYFDHEKRADAECIAVNGIYFDRNFVKLELNDNNSAVTVSSEPVFSKDVTFADKKYSYSVHINMSSEMGVGVGDHHIPDDLSSDGLTWTFEPQTTEHLREGNYLESGSYSAYTDITVNIIYDDIIWYVRAAKTHEFNYSL